MGQSTHSRDSRRRRKRKGTANVFEEIMAENFPNLKKETARYRKHRESQTNDHNRPTPRHIIIKMA